MAIAGKVAPVPKDAWNSSTNYEKLNIVTHANCTFMAKQNNTGHEPVAETSDNYWMFLVRDGDGAVDFTGATSSTAGRHGLVPVPAAGKQNAYLKGDGTWGDIVNNLTSDSTTAPLSAAQGKALNDGKLSTTGASTNNTVTYTSNDDANIFNSGNLAGQTAYPWTGVAKIATGEKHSALFNKISTMFKNIRTIAKLIGTTDISSIGTGTISNAIYTINSDLSELEKHIYNSTITITSYTSVSNPFVCPSDGYARVNASGSIKLVTDDSDESKILVENKTTGILSVFVKKGTKLVVSGNATFITLK